MEEPICHFYKKSGFDRSLIKKYVIGEKFVCIMLTDGRIGICSTLESKVKPDMFERGKAPDTASEGDRIILNAYYNALYNYSIKYEGHSDIIDAVDFTRFSDIVMIGYFETLYGKFRKINPALHVFDRLVENSDTEPIARMNEALARTEAVVVTGTTLFNGSLLEILDVTSDRCSVFLLGPSNILHTDMFRYRNVKMVFGSVFDRFDKEIVDHVERGLSAREFLKINNKVYIKNNNSDF